MPGCDTEAGCRGNVRKGGHLNAKGGANVGFPRWGGGAVEEAAHTVPAGVSTGRTCPPHAKEVALQAMSH